MTTPGILFTRSSHFPHKLGKAPAQAGAFRLPASPWEREKPDFFKIHFHKNYTNAQSVRERALFCWSWRSAGQRGREGVSTPPPYPLWTPYPPAMTRAEPWTQKQKVAPGVWLKKLFTARQMDCASLFPGAIRPALRFVCAPFGRACTQPGEPKRINIQNHRINNPNIHFTLPPKVTKRKQKPKNSKSGLDTGGGYAIMPLKGKDLPFNLFWVSIFYTP